MREKYIKWPFHSAFLLLTLTSKAPNRKSKDNLLFEKNLSMELLVEGGISFMHSILKNP